MAAMKKGSLKSSLFLLLAAFIWGVAFVAQSVGMDYMGPFSFNGARFILGALVLLPLVAIRRQKAIKEGKEGAPFGVTLRGGILCGIALGSAALFQQFGIMYTSVGKAGFITAMYIVIVPVLGIFLRKKVGAKIWCGVGIAVVGLYLLCMTESGFSIQKGDLLLMLCALVFSMHILVIDYFSPKVDGVKMSCIQFFTCGILSGVGMFLTEHPQMSDILAAWMPILYAGVMSCGVAYTLQIVGQKGMNPTVASLILSMESVISVIAGWLILHQTLSTKELMGCVLMFAAIILVQLPDRAKK